MGRGIGGEISARMNHHHAARAAYVDQRRLFEVQVPVSSSYRSEGAQTRHSETHGGFHELQYACPRSTHLLQYQGRPWH